MLRALKLLILLGLVIAAAMWLTDSPGTLSGEWRGYRVETSAALVITLVVLIACLTALLYRGWLFLRRSPGQIAQAWRDRRRRRGYEALTRGMVAIAAGDPGEARKHSKRAEALLNEPPLTMLLSAQAAQLGGDERAAEGFFKAMSERPETEFLGLRGLLAQALNRGDRDGALELARRAHRLRPGSEWVAGTLFDLQAGSGRWLDASVTNDDLARRRLVDRGTAERRKGVLAFEQSRQAREAGEGDAELRLLRQAQDLAPDLVPALTRLADRLAADGKERRAAALLEKAWARAPHPDLAAAFRRLKAPADALQGVKAMERLVRGNPDHAESHLALAEAATEARLWGEARKHLAPLLKEGLSEGYEGRAARLMAAVAEGEGDDQGEARDWLLRAATSGPDRAWVCSACGNTVPEWTVACGNCATFDSYAWGAPPHVGRPADRLGGAHPAALPGPGDGGA